MRVTAGVVNYPCYWYRKRGYLEKCCYKGSEAGGNNAFLLYYSSHPYPTNDESLATTKITHQLPSVRPLRERGGSRFGEGAFAAPAFPELYSEVDLLLPARSREQARAELEQRAARGSHPRRHHHLRMRTLRRARDHTGDCLSLVSPSPSLPLPLILHALSTFLVPPSLIPRFLSPSSLSLSRPKTSHMPGRAATPLTSHIRTPTVSFPAAMKRFFAAVASANPSSREQKRARGAGGETSGRRGGEPRADLVSSDDLVPGPQYTLQTDWKKLGLIETPQG
eukprot:748533-Hanusia_phi.AAC.10